MLGIALHLALSACSDDTTETVSSGSQAAASTSTTGGGGSGGGSGGAGGATTCDDSKPDPATNPAGTCENLGPVCAPYCDHAILALKPGVAYDAITCLATKTDCDMTGVDCMLEALAKTACPDASADDDCAQVAMLCSEAAGGAVCHDMMDGMVEPARAAAISCAQQACVGTVEPCVRMVLTPPPM